MVGTRGKAEVLPYLTGHFILGGLAQKFDVSDLAIGVEGVHEDAEAPAWCSFFFLQICEDPVFGLCLDVQQHCLLLLASGQELFVRQHCRTQEADMQQALHWQERRTVSATKLKDTLLGPSAARHSTSCL